MLMMAGGLAALTILRMASITPKLVAVSAHEATTIAALGAAALAHSASRVTSALNSGTTPGSRQLFPPGIWGWIVLKEPRLYPDRPRVERKVVQSLLSNILVSSTTTMVCP